MENHRVKSLSLDPRSRNRFRFASQKQREQRATADVYRGYKRRIGVSSSANREEAIHHTQEHPSKKIRLDEEGLVASAAAITDLQSASLAEELDLAFDRNSSELFSKFYRQIWYNVRSLPEILHHREKIVQTMLDYLVSPEEGSSDEDERVRYRPNQGTTDILHLLAVLARDLRHEIHPFLHSKILPRIIDDLLNPPMAKKQTVPLDVSIIEASIRTMSYCFRYDAESLVSETTKEGDQPCLEPMRQYYGKTLAHRREVVRRLSAEAYAPLIRRLPSDSARKRHLKRIFKAMAAVASDDASLQQAQENAADGISRLCLQLVRGISGRLHSKADPLVKTVLECCCTRHDKDAANRVLLNIGIKFLDELCQYLKTAIASSVFENVTKLLAKQVKEQKNSVCTSTLMKLTSQVASYDEGILVRTSDITAGLLSTLESIFGQSFFQDLSTEDRATAFDLFCHIWRAVPAEKGVIDAMSRILESATAVLLKDGEGYKYFLGLLTQKILPVLPMNLSMKTLGSILLKSAARTGNRDFTFSLILALCSAREIEEDSFVETDSAIFLENALVCDTTQETWGPLLGQCLFQFEEDGALNNNAVLWANAIQASVFVGMLSCTKSALKKDVVKVFEQVTAWLRSFLEQTASKVEYSSPNGITSDISVCVSLAIEGIARYTSVVKRFLGDSNRALKATLSGVQGFVLQHLQLYPKSIWATKSVSLYVKQLKEVTQKLLDDDSNKIFDLLVPNLATASHFLRLHSLEILATYPDKPFISDHADLDLSGDLDEEPSEAPNSQERKTSGLTGMCRVVHTLINLEQTPADLRNERKLISLISEVEVYGRSEKMPVPYVEASLSHLLGMFHVRFSPIWPAIQSAVVCLLHNCDTYSWPIFYEKMSKLMFSPPESQLSHEFEDFQDGMRLLNHFQQWDLSRGWDITLFKKNVAMSEELGRVSRHLARTGEDVVLSVWGTLEKKPQLIVTHSRDIVVIVLRFLVSQFFKVEDPESAEIDIRSHFQSDQST